MRNQKAQVLVRIETINWHEAGMPHTAGWLRDIWSGDKDAGLAACHKLEDLIQQGSERPEEYPPFERFLLGRDWLIIVPVLIQLVEHSEKVVQCCVLEKLANIASISLYHLMDFSSPPFAEKAHLLIEAVQEGRIIYSKIAQSEDEYARKYAEHILNKLKHYDSIRKKG